MKSDKKFFVEEFLVEFFQEFLLDSTLLSERTFLFNVLFYLI